MLDVAFAKSVLPKSGALVLLAEEGGSRDALFTAADQATGGALTRALEAAEFTGRKAQTCTILGPGAGFSRVVVVGLGKLAEVTPVVAEEVGGAIVAALAREPAVAVAAAELTADLAAAVAYGAVLRAYRFDRYRTKEKPEDKPNLAKLTLLVADAGRVREAWASARAVAEGVHLCRDLVSEPANVLTPAEMAERCRKLESLGLKVEVFGPKEMARLGFGALLGVAQGSANEPRMVVLHWQGASTSGKGRRARSAKPLAFIGKGVTFDTGGISIKPAQGMEDMKYDMAGAGAVIGLMAALAGRKARVDVVGLVGLVENMPSGTAQRPGDVVKTASGQTVEVINTDAEGRLVLADVLWYCQEKLDPAFMIDLATLTGAMVVALGHEHAGFFSNDEELAQRLHAAGEATGEKVWRMPLADAYDKLIKSDIADMKNIGGRPAGAISAAQFLQRFVNGKSWAHIDIAGTAWATKDQPVTPKGATGFGVRLLDRLVADHFET
ncbi:putative cytosol aminopeptidase [Rhodovastum atsumiense]|uniref:Probable cytosol aminopeptidase n=1 Tax=Rhodovastum atsumiense TaxID=504468 RepID=A0A5M6IUN8_9PROT|nr:leucyl aminopeptidase [Rhodovastum atsumiense]KAA5612014.1 leucyl aminopeptidase [Rhodovastum atsumiense]CAH2604126.1 putative cytosol aminopeptidase [Rhodovastum atsumiense]